MAYLLRMPVQIGDWLADLNRTEPIAAAEAGATLIALLDADDVLRQPFVTDPHAVEPADPRAVLDDAYRELLVELQIVRRRVADAATSLRRAELQLAALRDDPDADPAVIEATERQAADAQRREQQLTVRSQRLQARVDAFRTRKETIKASYTAAEAQARIAEAMAELQKLLPESDADDVSPAAEGPDEPGSSAGEHASDSNEAAPGDAASKQPGRHEDADVLELAADPLGTDIRILFAVEPADTITVLTVVEGRDAVRDSKLEAVDVAAELLGEIRTAGLSPEEASADQDWLEFAGATSFLDRFFADRSEAVTARARELSASATLAMLRELRGMSLRRLARAAGIDDRRLAFIERHGPQAAEPHELAAYLRQLGGRLELSVVIDGERRGLL